MVTNVVSRAGFIGDQHSHRAGVRAGAGAGGIGGGGGGMRSYCVGCRGTISTSSILHSPIVMEGICEPK